MMNQRRGLNRNSVSWYPELPWVSNNTTELPEQKEITNWNPNVLATEKTKSSPKVIYLVYLGSITESDARLTDVQLKREAKL